MSALDAIRAADFDWAVRLNDVWSKPAADVDRLHAKIRAEFAEKLDEMADRPGAGAPLGWPIVGSGGTGKTHLLGAFRREAMRRRCAFILVDLTDVRNFWETVLQGYMNSLQHRFDGDVPQHKWLLDNIIAKYGPSRSFAEILATLLGRKSRDLRGDVNAMLGALSKSYNQETFNYQNVVRALVCLNSDDFTTSNVGHVWLQGQRLEEEDRLRLGFTAHQEAPLKIVEALSWFLSLSGPTILAFDQLDPIVTQLNFRGKGDPSSATAEQAAAMAIISDIAGGLGALRDRTRNTLTVLSCIEATWEVFRSGVLKAALDRFEEPRRLGATRDAEIARAIVAGRLAPGFTATGFAPPYPTYPFRAEAFEALTLDSPREILKRCDAHRRECLHQKGVLELGLFTPGGIVDKSEHTVDSIAAKRLDREFETLRAAANPAWILEEKFDDERLAPLLQSALACLLHESDPGPDVDGQVDVEFTGGAKTVPLHARLRLIFTKEDEREEHYCVRALQQTHARAYQVRLKGALTQAGIDRDLPFRRLALVRSTPIPGGVETRKLTAEFERFGGVFVYPTDDELRTLHALHELKKRNDPEFKPWLKDRRLASNLAIVRGIVGDDWIGNGKGDEPTTNGAANGAGGSTTVVSPPPAGTTPASSSDGRLPLGRRLIGGRAGEAVGMPVGLLAKHALVLAGAGAGKTVFLKRLIEESALLGVPSIVVDPANDLAALDERWDESPAAWTDDDRAKADHYRLRAEVVFWTPGKESGNPLSFEPLPDLGPLADDKDELNEASAMVVETLTPILAPGQSHTAKQKRAVLTSSLRYLASHGGGRLDSLIQLLDDLPPEAGLGVANEARLASQMSDALKAEVETNPLLGSRGTAFDPAVLLGSGGASSPARISIISLVGLPGIEAQRYFLNQLAMTLFSWIKANPDPGDRPLRGLLVIDEAKDFAPSQKATVCRESLIRLVAQARKYRLGVVFATQNPKDLDHRIMSNCSTHVYGKVNSPAAIDAVRALIQEKGGAAPDLATLPRGQFYAHNADAEIARPTKIAVPLCLSRHGGPLDEAAVVAKAVACRARLHTRPNGPRPHLSDRP